MTDITEGLLVRVTPAALMDDRMTDHGLLWVIIHKDNRIKEPNHKLHWCRSLTTGMEHCWYRREFEVQDGAS